MGSVYGAVCWTPVAGNEGTSSPWIGFPLGKMGGQSGGRPALGWGLSQKRALTSSWWVGVRPAGPGSPHTGDQSRDATVTQVGPHGAVACLGAGGYMALHHQPLLPGGEPAGPGLSVPFQP